jgi:sterol desaturase/sphingolipid hydroxylase (fatty acid hydroxylase superfamily)
MFVWPVRPVDVLKWAFGYFWPWNLTYIALAVVTWLFLTPDLARMKDFEIGWIAFIACRNLLLLFLTVGTWHFWLYIHRAQGLDYKYNGRWLDAKNPTFLFGNQVLDNVFWNIASAWPIWTTYEVVTFWGYANHLLPYVSWESHPVYCVLLLCVIPFIHDVHFYLIHRMLHWPVFYRMAHNLHHKNVNVGPWSGVAMHPIEHLVYFTSALLHWIIPSHPLHVIFHFQYVALAPAQGHSGFERVVMNDKVAIKTNNYFHYLHHKFFECNYGSMLLPLDKWFGTYHDGSEEAQEAMIGRVHKRQ